MSFGEGRGLPFLTWFWGFGFPHSATVRASVPRAPHPPVQAIAAQLIPSDCFIGVKLHAD